MEIHTLKAKARQQVEDCAGDTTTVYLLEKTEQMPDEAEINRILGHPIGVSDSRWPQYQGRKMFHVLTLDLDTTPRLKEKFPSDTRAIALFISSLIMNEAFEADSDECTLLALTAADLALGVNSSGPGIRDDYETHFGEFQADQADDGSVLPSGFVCHELVVPAEIFAREDLYFERGQNDPLVELSNDLFNHAFAGGAPIWLQGDEFEGEFLFQFDENLVDMNLGDAGVMYVFKETAFWQCC